MEQNAHANPTSEELERLRKLREHYRSKAFRLMLELLVIFGAPAAIAFFGGRALDVSLGTDNKMFQLLSLGVAFVLSWAIVIAKYRKLDKELKEIDDSIKRERDALGIVAPESDHEERESEAEIFT